MVICDTVRSADGDIAGAGAARRPIGIGHMRA
jgi:hypothetical protein